MANNPKGSGLKYSKTESSIKPITPSQWDRQNLAKGYVAHPGYSNGKKTPGEYKEYYNPSEFTPKLNKDGVYQWSNIKDPNFDFSTGSPVEKYTHPSVLVPPEIDPNVKPLQFTPNYTLNPNTGIATLPNGELVDPTVEYKKGGLVKKVRKYASGGEIDADQAAIIGTGVNSALDLGEGIAGYNAEKKAFKPQVDPLVAPEYMEQTKNSKLGQGVGSAAGAGLGFGAGVALTAVTGGAAAPLIVPLTGLGQKAGSFTGKVIGNHFDHKNSKQKYNSDTNEYNQNQILADNQAKFQTNLANQLSSRNTYSKGGKIVGKGTGTSDSIKAKVKENSYVIPSKNAKVAEVIREEVLEESPEKKANLKQSGGEEVKVSNGEHLFTEKENIELLNKGIDISQLAPDADDKKMLAKGGPTGEDPFKSIRDRTLKAQKEADIAELKTLTEEYKTLKAKSNSSNPIERSEYNRRIVGLASRMKQISDKHDLNTKDIPSKTGAEVNKILKEPSVKIELGRSAIVPKSKLSDSNKIFAKSNLAQNMANQDTDNAVVPPSTGLGKIASGNAIDDAAKNSDLVNSALQAEKNYTPPIPVKQDYVGKGLSGLSTLVNYGVPIAQTAIGLNYLKKAGDRPIDQIDPIFQQTLNNANTRASYGFTPEENAMITNQNNNLTSAQRFAARNYSGGNAGNAYNMERDAINESFGRGLSSAVQNRQLQLNKQQYADQIGLNKVELSRRLFNDKLGAWQQSQQAGQNLIGAGLSNLVGSGRYEAEKRAAANTANIENSWLNQI